MGAVALMDPHFAYRTNKFTVWLILQGSMLASINIWFERGKPMRLSEHTMLLTEEISQTKNSKIAADISMKKICESIPYLCRHKGYPMGISQFTVEINMPADVVKWTLKKYLVGSPVGGA